jgi:cytochrome c551/c552
MGLALCAAEPLRVATLHAAGQVGSKTVAASSQAANQRPPDRALLDQYCVTCHNERLKTGGVSLDNVDVSDTRANADVLEKIIRKLRTGQMPPMGRPRPDDAPSMRSRVRWRLSSIAPPP